VVILPERPYKGGGMEGGGRRKGTGEGKVAPWVSGGAPLVCIYSGQIFLPLAPRRCCKMPKRSLIALFVQFSLVREFVELLVVASLKMQNHSATCCQNYQKSSMQLGSL